MLHDIIVACDRVKFAAFCEKYDYYVVDSVIPLLSRNRDTVSPDFFEFAIDWIHDNCPIDMYATTRSGPIPSRRKTTALLTIHNRY